MQGRQIDPDVTIIEESIPPNRNHSLLSRVRLKTESRVPETVDLTLSDLPVSVCEAAEHGSLKSVNLEKVQAVRPSINISYIRPNAQITAIKPSNNNQIVGLRNIEPRMSNNVNSGNCVVTPIASQSQASRSPFNINSEFSDLISSDISLPTLQELLSFIQSRKGISNIIDLKNIASVNIHELLKSTPAECFSRKGFYSCAGCSSKFTSSEMYNFHLNRRIGDFSYDCEHCSDIVKADNHCQISMHLLANHKINALSQDKVTHKSYLTFDNPVNEVVDDFEETSKLSMKKVIEGFLNDWNVDLFNPYQRRTKDQRYFLLPLARKDVVQSHKFYSDHYRAANRKLKEYPVELMHCFMCDFVCEKHNELIDHLQGDWPNTVTKCAFCTLSVPINKESLCAAKAHVLLHMGIFIMCPRCGFVPPPDLNPDDFEITLRLHLRYVCFHFNLIQIFICPHCGDNNSKAFNTANQVIMHIYEEHLTEQRYCSICRPPSESALGTCMSSSEFHNHLNIVHNRTDVDHVWNENIIGGKKCSECSDLISQKESFFSHMTVHHKMHIVKGKSAFRCFGTCKRIHQSIDEFQSHRSECSECVNVKNKLYQPHLTTAEATSLCFCLYCGVGVRRKRLENGDIETQSEPQMFPNLDETHLHEQDHILCETNITACPWCPNRMSAKVTEMTQHMETHLPDNWFLNWYTKRNKTYHFEPNEVVYCYCYAAIDNPLSLHCHAIPQILSASSQNSATIKHVALTDSIHREFVTSLRHSAVGSCPLCSEADIFTNSLEMTWHIFYKHRNILCYVCKNYHLINADNSPTSRITMWNHVYQCLRQHTPRFNLKSGLSLLKNIANCENVMSNCTEFDLSKISEINIGSNNDLSVVSDHALSSGGTELANSHHSDSRYECGYCKETALYSKLFSSKLLLNEHLKVSHGVTTEAPNNGTEYLCFVCGLKFDCLEKWEDHTLSDHSKGFRKIGMSMLDPMDVILDTTCTTYRCYLCNHRFDKKSSCEEHMKAKHEIEHSDLNWGMLTDNSVILDSSKRSKPSINSSKTCLLTYPCKRLKIEGSGSDSENVFVCGVCPLQCSSRKDMITHAFCCHLQSSEKLLNNNNCYVCPDCCLSFISKKSRSIHLKLIHKVGEPDKFIESVTLSM